MFLCQLPKPLAYLASLVLVAGLSTSKSMLSSSTIAFAVLILWTWACQGKISWPRSPIRTEAMGIMGLFGLALLSGFWSQDLVRWAWDCYEKLPLLVIPLALTILPPFSRAGWRTVVVVFVAIQTLVALLTLIQFASTFQFQMERVADNAFVEIYGHISHIYFGLLLGLAVLFGLWLWQDSRGHWSPRYRMLWLLVLLFDAVAIHVIVSRTGLLSFYAGVGAYLLVTLYHRIRIGWSLALLAGLVLAPVVAYHTIPSFRVRLQVSYWDWQQFRAEEADLSDNSLSLRLLAWQASTAIIAEHPWLGVGIEDLPEAMMEQYEELGLDRRAVGLLGEPHNQFLKLWAGVGILGLVVLLGVLIYPFWVFRGRIPPLVAAFFIALGVAMCFESLLERQVGMTAFAALGIWVMRELKLPGPGSEIGQKDEAPERPSRNDPETPAG